MLTRCPRLSPVGPKEKATSCDPGSTATSRGHPPRPIPSTDTTVPGSPRSRIRPFATTTDAAGGGSWLLGGAGDEGGLGTDVALGGPGGREFDVGGESEGGGT